MKANFILSALIPLALGLLFSPSFSQAQGCHQDGGQSSGHMSHMPDRTSSANPARFATHSGTVSPAGKFYVEMVYDYRLANGPIQIYLMNKRGKPISDLSITGKADITYPDGSIDAIILESSGENGFIGAIPKKTASFFCLLTLKIGNENVMTRFDSGSPVPENVSAAPVYTCSMHPEVLSDKPGDCPKCGMSLVKKSNK